MKGLTAIYFLTAIALLFMLLAAPVLRAQESGESPESATSGNTQSDVSSADPCPQDLIGSTPSVEEKEEPPVKHIIISLADQKMWIFEDNKVVQRFPVSTGRPGHATPAGEYSVHSRSPKAWSRKYECYMLQWMSITSDGQIGMHALEGHSYERHLGHVASHGCIRLSHTNAQWLYEWVEIGIKVEIVSDYEEPVEEPLEEYPFHW
jgi:lipoprotein-anchoring transpeptidase ErfK/SrfK